MPRLSDSDYAILAELEADARSLAACEFDTADLADLLYSEEFAPELYDLQAGFPPAPWPTPEEVDAMAEQMGGNDPDINDRLPDTQAVEGRGA